jgi:Tfp pilus assembly protein PilO
MIDWGRALQEKRRLIVPLAVAAVVNVVVYFAVVYPLSARTASVEVRAQMAVAKAANAANTLRAAEATRAGRARADEQLTRFYAEILPRDQAGARRITYLRLAKLAEESNLDYESRNAKVQQDRDSELEHLDMTMVLTGEYRDIRQFVHTLDSAPEFVIIRDVALAQNEPDQPLTLTLELSTYYRAQP